MLGYCGINCGECPAYKGTVSHDLTLLEKAAGSFWDGAYSAAEWVCLGCQPADQPFIAKFCAKCQIRACAIEKGVSNCAACDSFENCRRLQDFISGESEELVHKMTLLHQRYQDSRK